MNIDIDKGNIIRVLNMLHPKKCKYLMHTTDSLSHIKLELDQAIHLFTTHIKVEGEFRDFGTKVHCYKPGDAIAWHVDDPRLVDLDGKLWRPFATMIVFLNTTPYGNGAVEFPRQKHTLVPLEGTALFFPVGWTHPYMQKPLQVSKWCMLSWIYRESHINQS